MYTIRTYYTVEHNYNVVIQLFNAKYGHEPPAKRQKLLLREQLSLLQNSLHYTKETVITYNSYKYKNQLNKLWNEVGMKVPKSTRTR